MNKLALHQHDRGAERLNLSRESVDSIQKAVDKMWFSGGYKKLGDNFYHLNIRDPNKSLLGYAALKRINNEGRRPRLILASILQKHMKPRGTNISHFVDATVKDNGVRFPVQKPFQGFHKIPNRVDRK